MNGWPITTRPGCWHWLCRLVGRKPEEEDEMMTWGAATASMSRNSLIFSSSRSGAASWMKSALAAITLRSVVKDSLPFFLGLPRRASSEGQAVLIWALSRSSAAGDTS